MLGFFATTGALIGITAGIVAHRRKMAHTGKR